MVKVSFEIEGKKPFSIKISEDEALEIIRNLTGFSLKEKLEPTIKEKNGFRRVVTITKENVDEYKLKYPSQDAIIKLIKGKPHYLHTIPMITEKLVGVRLVGVRTSKSMKNAYDKIYDRIRRAHKRIEKKENGKFERIPNTESPEIALYKFFRRE